MNGLMLHCGASSISRNELAAMPLPEPRGSRHVIRPYLEDVVLVEAALANWGIAIRDEAFGISANGNRFFGVMECAPLEGEYISKNDYGLMVGLRGSYDQSIARGLAVGSRVFVCDNLSFSGEISILTRQTTHVAERLPDMLYAAVEKIPAMAQHQRERFDRYKLTQLTMRQGDAIITEFVRRGIVNPSQVGRVIQEWDSPSHAEHAEDGYSVWRMHNAVTEGIKATRERLAIASIWERTIPLTTFLDGVAGIH